MEKKEVVKVIFLAGRHNAISSQIAEAAFEVWLLEAKEELRELERDNLIAKLKRIYERFGIDTAAYTGDDWERIASEVQRRLADVYIAIDRSEGIDLEKVAVACASGQVYEDLYSGLMSDLMNGIGEDPQQRAAQVQFKGYESYKRKRQQNMCPADYGAYKNNRRKW